MHNYNFTSYTLDNNYKTNILSCLHLETCEVQIETQLSVELVLG